MEGWCINTTAQKHLACSLARMRAACPAPFSALALVNDRKAIPFHNTTAAMPLQIFVGIDASTFSMAVQQHRRLRGISASAVAMVKVKVSVCLVARLIQTRPSAAKFTSAV